MKKIRNKYANKLLKLYKKLYPTLTEKKLFDMIDLDIKKFVKKKMGFK